MTDPSTPAGRTYGDAKTWEALVHAIHAYIADRTTTNWLAVEDAMQHRDDYHRAAIEAEARAEGRREAVHAIRSEFSLNAWPCHECDNGPMLYAILDHVAGLNASEPRLCACGAPAEWPDGKCDKHHARRGLRDASQPRSTDDE